MREKIRVAIVGVGNCASSLVQGISYYSERNDADGLITEIVGGYAVSDIEVVAAFDVAATKVGLDLHDAIFAEPNNTLVFHRPDRARGPSGVIVQRGPTYDGFGKYLTENVPESEADPVYIVEALKAAGADVVISYLPVGSEQAAKFYAQAAIDAGCALVNCMPVFIASDPEWAARFREAGLPIIGDDIKSQVGATIVHRVLARLMHERGVRLVRTSQLNVGGNTDFLNMLERERLKSKKISKTQAVTSIMGVELPEQDVHVGPSDYVPWLKDRKWAHIRLEGEGFGGAVTTLEVKLEVHDSPNSAGVVMDALRWAAVAMDHGECGPFDPACSVYMKSPPVQIEDFEAMETLANLNHPEKI